MQQQPQISTSERLILRPEVTTEEPQAIPEQSPALLERVRRHLGRSARKATALAGIGLAALSGMDGLADARAYEVITNPIHYAGQPMPCPDPSVAHGINNPNNLYVACTSDYGQLNPTRNGGLGKVAAAYPIYRSTDGGFKWSFVNYVFPPGHKANGGEMPRGNWPGPRYWAPDLRYNSNSKNWDVYFTTSMPSGQMALFVAWSKNIASGNWHSRRLHYKGQFNNVAGNQQEGMGGLIDPNVAEDPKTKQLFITYCDQPNQLWLGTLSPNGLSMNKHVRRIAWPTQKWEGGVLEGPVDFWDKKNQTLDILYNADSTWAGNYKVGFLASTDPMHGAWIKYSHPLLQSGNGLHGPGMGSQPIKESDGRYYLYVHSQLRAPNHASQERYLTREPFSFTGRHVMYLPDGDSSNTSTSGNPNIYYYDQQSKKYLPESNYASQSSTPTKVHQIFEKISVPRIGTGRTQRRIVIPKG